MTSKCCGYGNAGDNMANGFDCALIPGASKLATANGLADTLNNGAGNGFCGGELATIQANNAAATVCCKWYWL